MIPSSSTSSVCQRTLFLVTCLCCLVQSTPTLFNGRWPLTYRSGSLSRRSSSSNAAPVIGEELRERRQQSQQLFLQGCAAAINNGDLNNDNARLCRAVVRAVLRRRAESIDNQPAFDEALAREIQAVMEGSTTPSAGSLSNLQNMNDDDENGDSNFDTSTIDGSEEEVSPNIPRKPKGAYFYSPFSKTWTKIRF